MILKVTVDGIPRPFSITVKTFEDASREYIRIRDSFLARADEISFGQVYDGATRVAEVSYNGRVWLRETSPS